MNIDKAMEVSEYDCGERRRELMWLAKQASTRKSIVEVGSWLGCTALAMADNTSGKVYCVDTFAGSVNEEKQQRLTEREEDWLYKQFIKNTAGHSNIFVMRMTSLEAAEQARTLGQKFDMIFLDASHDLDSVRGDLLAWLPLLAPRGLICGHDREWDGVKQAVNELIPNNGVGAGAIWYKPL